MTATTGTTIVWVESHLFCLAPSTDEMLLPDWRGAGDVPPLVAPTISGDGVVITTGVSVGPVEVTVGEPGADPSGWEEHASVEIAVSGPLVVSTPGQEPVEVHRPAAGQIVKVDVWASGRQRNWDLSFSPRKRDNLEQYLVMFTPLGPGTGG